MPARMEFHIARSVRDLTELDESLFSYTGNVVFANVAASRKLAQQLNVARGTERDPKRAINAGALFAMGLIDELQHALIDAYRKEVDPAVLSAALQWFSSQTSPEKLDALLLAFTEQFPNVAVYRKQLTANEWLAAAEDGLPNREAALEELMLLWLANSNPAFTPFRELFEDTELQTAAPAYKTVTEALPSYFETRPKVSPEIGTLLDALMAPITASPDSLTGQLEYIRTHWTVQLGGRLKSTLLAIDTLREEEIAIWRMFNPAGPDRHRHGAFGTAKEGFVGDEYMGFGDYEDEEITLPDGRRVRRRRYATDYQAPLNEYEAFSADQAWMPNVVLLAKSTYVWLEQLSQKYGRHIYRLDHVPEEELQLMARRGITGLWLIGLWERSVASKTIKHLRGHIDAVASAYSLKDYQIAEDLGGNEAYTQLRDRAARYGLRLASDMVPNHMGIDSPWVIEHPDWFLYRWESPYPVYSFNGPDLSNDSRVEIKLEDHYYDQTDAAVVFRLRHHADGATRYMYHGNDGTTFAWNDTAQLDYSKAEVREHVMQVILHVARMFPIIRFDAAMVLAKRHVQRLWFPLPGAGGSIPSRAENAISDEEFNALMPNEFWREVVDRVAVEVPGTLLLAEAFWLLEGYFVRTLGMHRVYNSAFMVMLRDEDNAKYRSYLKKTLEFDPDILKRYVNFMSNPDEKTAIAQFGTGDKYFGVSTLLATLPGLPMFGHGQIEGFTEQYGMEFKAAKMKEWPNEGLISRFEHEIAPLLRNRKIFAESANFVLYDFWKGDGSVDENVFAYSNNYYGERSLILYNNTYPSTRGTIHTSVGFMDKGSGEMRQRAIADGLALPYDGDLFVAYRDVTSNLEYLRRATDIHHNGLTFDLRGFQYIVLLNFRELRATAEKPWDQLHDMLHGAGVYSLDEAITRLRLRPVHDALRLTIQEANLPLAPEEASNTGKAQTLDSTLARNATDFLNSAKEFLAESNIHLTVPSGVRASRGAGAAGSLASLAAQGTQGLAKQLDGVAKATSAAASEHHEAGLLHVLEGVAHEARAVAHGVAAALDHLLHHDSAAEKREPQAQPGAAGDITASAVTAVAPAGHEGDGEAALQAVAEKAAAPEPTLDAVFESNLQRNIALLLERHYREGQPTTVPGVPALLAPRRDAVLLASALVRALPVDEQTPRIHADLFDRLQLRHALAETFTALGFEGDAAWRAAAVVRIATAHNIGSLNTESFWADGDVRWVLNVNESEGTEYFNRELFAALLPWLELEPETTPLTADEKSLDERLLDRAEKAGYQLRKFLHEPGFAERSHGLVGVEELAAK
ncbi:alpha-amylase family glycosyl hydrolase [Terriglobus aquaticus]|uniref:Alpha-amylase family glycosyl hydrolase n=2 Tax=Terriglobus aquaticus TaxID=940139 RepID=A0ABW9KPD7_9BACT|nr:alpha-amylase family glycosyl hydrolase [Terriglobus aquaticus]